MKDGIDRDSDAGFRRGGVKRTRGLEALGMQGMKDEGWITDCCREGG